jgi:hypothetical protein
MHKANFVKQWAEEHFWNLCFKSHRCPGLSFCLGISEVVEILFHSVHSDKGVFPLYDMSPSLQRIAWDCHWVSHVMIPWHLQTQLTKNNEACYCTSVAISLGFERWSELQNALTSKMTGTFLSSHCFVLGSGSLHVFLESHYCWCNSLDQNCENIPLLMTVQCSSFSIAGNLKACATFPPPKVVVYYWKLCLQQFHMFPLCSPQSSPPVPPSL